MVEWRPGVALADTAAGEACVRKAPPLRETRAPQSAKQRRKAYQKLIGSEDDPLPATNTGWRAHFTQHAMLAWRTEWESCRRGKPLVAPGGRAIGAQFSTAAGRVGVISHCGLASPSHLVEDPEATAGTNSASVQRGLLDMVADFRDCCKMVMVLGDLNVQRRLDRLDVQEGGSADVAHKLWDRFMAGGGLV